MTETEFHALELWILAAIERSDVKGSCGPHVRPIKENYEYQRNLARDALVLGLDYMKDEGR